MTHTEKTVIMNGVEYVVHVYPTMHYQPQTVIDCLDDGRRWSDEAIRLRADQPRRRSGATASRRKVA